MKEYLLKEIRLIESSKGAIIGGWVESDVVAEIFKKYNISTPLFSNHFAIRILDYFIGVVKGEKEQGQCPAVGVMLQFFHHKNIMLDDVFLICDNFKKSVLLFLYDQSELTQDAIEGVFYLFGTNFAGVIREYVEKNYTPASKQAVSVKQSAEKTKQRAPEAVLQAVMPKDDDIQDSVTLDEEDIAMLDDIYDELSDYLRLYYAQNVSKEATERFIGSFEKLGDKLLFIGDKKFGHSLLDLTTQMRVNEQRLHEIIDTLIYMFEATLNDIQVWIEGLSRGLIDAKLEESMIANFEQLKVKISGEDAGDIELF